MLIFQFQYYNFSNFRRHQKMGNCCSNIFPEIGFKGTSTQTSSLKDIALQSVPNIGKTGQCPKEVPTNNPAPAAQQRRAKPIIVYNWSLLATEDTFRQLMEQIKELLFKTIDPNISLLEKQLWVKILQPIDKHYLTLSDRIDFLSEFYRFVKVELKHQWTEQEQEQDFSDLLCDTEHAEQFGYRLRTIKKRIQKRKQQSPKYLAFLKEFSKFKPDFSDLNEVAEKTKDLCTIDMNAFSFITLYLTNCINQQLNANPHQLFEIIDKLKNILNQLSEKYPPSSLQKNENEEEDKEPEVEKISYDCKINYPTLKFEKTTGKERMEEIQKFIIRNARQAKADQLFFEAFLKPICHSRGNHFKSALKLKRYTQQQLLAFYRIKEKVIDKDHSDKFKEQLQGKKTQIINAIQEKKDLNKAYTFSRQWMRMIHNIEKQIIEGKDELVFTIADLLRGKAMFKSRADIRKTVKQIQKELVQWQQKDTDNYRILNTEDRLDEHTKDFKLIIKIGDTISQLQLAKQMNVESNEFNHKIYQLKRSKMLTPLFNLCLLNEKLAQTFFIDEFQFYAYNMEAGNAYFCQNYEDFRTFKKTLLSKNTDAFQSSESSQNRLFTQSTTDQMKLIKWYTNVIYDALYQGYNKEKDFGNRTQLRKTNGYYFRDL